MIIVPFRRLSPILASLLVLGTLIFAASGCGPGNVIAKNKTVGEVDDQQATCKVAKDPLNPLIVEWPGTSKVSLDSASKRGIVVVSYAGCTLKVLNECHAKGAYEYSGVTPARDQIDISSQDDLYAKLPLGAVSLKGELDAGASLKLDYIAVGQRVAAEPPTELEGEGCEGATHYVRTITIGAYSLDAGAKAEAGASVDVGNAGGGVKRKEGDRRLKNSGDVDKCSSQAPKNEASAIDDGCGAPLQLDLAPLRQQGGNKVVASTFGENLGTLSLGPTQLSSNESNIGAVASLRDVDPDYLKLYQDALHADRGVAVRPQDKANAWAALASYPGQNPRKNFAEKRRDDWQKTADDLEKLKTQYLTDKAKLDKLLALDDEVVPKKDKVAYQEEFKQVYAPHEQLLSVALGTNIGASGGNGDGSDSSGGTKTPAGTSKAPQESFRLDASGGFVYRHFGYSDDTSGSNAAFDAGGAGGYGEIVATLPRIPIPGMGLSVLARFDGGGGATANASGVAAPGSLNTITVDGGLRFGFGNTASALGIGLYVGYLNFLGAAPPVVVPSHLDNGGNTVGPENLVVSTSGGVDFRLNLAYEYYLGQYVSLCLGGFLSGDVIPFTAAKGKDSISGSMKGFGAGVGGGLGFHFGQVDKK